MRELPQLSEAKCTGCGDCVVACPAECLELRGPYVWLPRPRDCLVCDACVLVCPTQAIQIAPLVPA
jgi:NAD-dependent dihydropyrimidine dehydrogenase PreA subunit